jgi:hypothetical protein
MTRFRCYMIGHDWMRNSAWPRIDGRSLGTSPDWQRCLRCGRWELVLDLAQTLRKASSGRLRRSERLEGRLD